MPLYHYISERTQENIHTVSLYVGAARQEEYYDFIINLAPKRVIFNPGTENPQFAQKLNKAGISWENALYAGFTFYESIPVLKR